MKIYMLTTNAERSLTISPINVDCFRDHFIGKKLPDNWSFPNIEILGKSYPVRDFVSWGMLQVIIISEKAKDILSALILPHVQILYLATIKNKKLYALNVVRLDDCLNWDKSECHYMASNSKVISEITKVVFDETKLSGSPIFKIKQFPSKIFVDERFVRLVLDNNLRGAHFLDPTDDSWWVKKVKDCGIAT